LITHKEIRRVKLNQNRLRGQRGGNLMRITHYFDWDWQGEVVIDLENGQSILPWSKDSQMDKSKPKRHLRSISESQPANKN